MILEVCVDSVESALAAQDGGAGRVELCADLDHGGITPSIGMIKSVREMVSLKIHVMIRPRAGNFCYSEAEYEVMKRDILAIKSLGVDGLVFGILTKAGMIDSVRTATLLEMTRPLSVTFHRAFDETVDQSLALTELIRLGIDRVLTSGGKPSAEAGIKALADLVRQSGSSIKLIAGGGITTENVSNVVNLSDVEEVHALSSVSTAIIDTSASSKFFGSPRLVADASKVRRMVTLLQGLSSRN